MAQTGPFSLSIDPARVGRVLGWSIATLVVLHLLGRVAVSRGHDSVHGLVPLFNLGNEYNVPSLFSTMLLLAAGGILLLIAHDAGRGSGRFRRHWILLGVTFIFLGIDETLGFHELLNAAVLQFATPTGLLFFPWVIVAIPIVAVFGLLYLPFLLHLPRRTAAGFAVAGTIYVGAAIGLEMIGAAIVDGSGRQTLAYTASQTLEEAFEMAGVALFIYVLLDYFAERHAEVRILTASRRRELPASAFGEMGRATGLGAGVTALRPERRMRERRSPSESLRRA